MSELVTKTAGAMTPAERRAALIQKAKERLAKGEAPRPPEGGVTYAKIDGNTGQFTFGRDKAEVPADTRFVVIIENCEHGWQNWQGGKVEKRLMVPVLDAGRPVPPAGEPRCGDLPKPRERDGWTETVSLRMQGVGGDLDGISMVLDCANQSSIGPADGLLADVLERMATDGAELFNPIVTISIGSYDNKAYRRTVYYPEFTIVAWTDGERTEDAAALAAVDDGAGVLD